MLLFTQVAFAGSYVVWLVAASAPVAPAVVVMVLGAVVFTLAELTGGPVLGALSAEAAPVHLRGRYLSLIQLAWNVASGIAPVLFAWLLDRGAGPLWWVMLGLSVVGALAVVRLGRVLPQAAQQVTNRAADEPTTA